MVTLLALSFTAGERASAVAQTGSVDLASAEEFDHSHRWHLFYSGDPFHGWRLTDVERWRAFRRPVWSFFYGEDSLEIQNWNVCVRFLARYPGHPKAFDFHGAKAARIRSAGSFEVYTGRTTVVIFGERPLDRRAGAVLRRIGRSHPPQRLRPPVKGSLRGKLRCQRKYR